MDFELTLSILKLKSMHIVLTTILLGFGLPTAKGLVCTTGTQPSVYTYNGGQEVCYWGSFSYNTKADAQLACENDGGTLAQVFDAGSTAVVASINSYLDDSSWISSYSSQPTTYTNWRTGHTPDAALCIYLYYRTGDWVSQACTVTHARICSKPVLSTMSTTLSPPTTQVPSTTEHAKFERFGNNKMLAVSPLTITSVPTVLKCAIDCDRIGCLSFNFNTMTLECQLLPQARNGDVLITTQGVQFYEVL